MSVDFAILNGPRHTIRETCFLCKQEREFAEEDGEPLPEWGCDACQDGWMVYDEPEARLNMSNANAASILRILGLPADQLWGTVPPEEVADLRRAVLRALNQDSARAKGVRETEIGMGKACGVTQEDGTVAIQPAMPRWVACGLSDEDIQERLRRFDAILGEAQELGLGVCWA